MLTVPASEFSKNFGRYRELVQRQTVAVTSHERVTGYFMSAAEYEELQRLKAMTTQSFAVEELPESAIRAIAESEMDARHAHLDKLMDE